MSDDRWYPIRDKAGNPVPCKHCGGALAGRMRDGVAEWTHVPGDAVDLGPFVGGEFRDCSLVLRATPPDTSGHAVAIMLLGIAIGRSVTEEVHG